MGNQPNEVLDQIIATWPVDEFGKWPKDDADKIKLRQRFQHLITDEFRVSTFAIRLNPQRAKLSEVLVTDKFAKAIIYDPDPLLAVLRQGNDGHWRLDLIAFQCASCFGSGIDYKSDICGTCGGAGWGLLGDVEFCSGDLSESD